jgi:hypothetical protein
MPDGHAARTVRVPSVRIRYDARTSSRFQRTGETVPRAKKTDRAAARRRSRAAGADTFADHDVDLDATAEDASRTSGPRKPDRPQFERPSITRAFREAFHPLDIREDLVTAPSVIFGSKAVWLPLLISAVAAGVFVAAQTSVTFLIFQYFVFTLPLGAVFLAGFFAPRSSWLAGFVVGLGTVAIFAISLSTGRLDVVYPSDTHGAYVSQSLLLSSVGGAFFASTAAWYRRFLRLSNPNRARARQQAQAARSDGRSRSTKPQGSNARR